jgi:uncharacterized lipoprotein YmbA
MKFPSLTLLLLAPLALSACSVLKPVKDTSVNHLLDPSVPERKITGNSPSVAISRPSLPSYLDRQQLVSRSKNGELEMNSYHLWAEPLDSAISRVTSINLARLNNSLNIQPVENFVTLDYQSLLEIRVAKFEPDPSGSLVLECTWKLQPVAGAIASPRAFHTAVPINKPQSEKDSSQSARIAASNEALARLAREISKAL